MLLTPIFLLVATQRDVNNTARYSGGGIYLYQSPMQCSDICVITLVSNCALHRGGGIYAVSSTIDILSSSDHKQASLLLLENSAQIGGGLYMEANAKLYISKAGHKPNEMMVSSCSVVFSYNFADYGGAVFVEDGTNLRDCDSIPPQTSSLIQERSHYANTDSESAAECFFDVLSLNQQSNLDYANGSINFNAQLCTLCWIYLIWRTVGQVHSWLFSHRRSNNKTVL